MSSTISYRRRLVLRTSSSEGTVKAHMIDLACFRWLMLHQIDYEYELCQSLFQFPSTLRTAGPDVR